MLCAWLYLLNESPAAGECCISLLQLAQQRCHARRSVIHLGLLAAQSCVGCRVALLLGRVGGLGMFRACALRLECLTQPANLITVCRPRTTQAHSNAASRCSLGLGFGLGLDLGLGTGFGLGLEVGWPRANS